jgi:hypothetical protein
MRTSSLDGSTPDHAYFTRPPLRMAPNLGRGSTYRCGKPVQITGPSLLVNSPRPRSLRCSAMHLATVDCATAKPSTLGQHVVSESVRGRFEDQLGLVGHAEN